MIEYFKLLNTKLIIHRVASSEVIAIKETEGSHILFDTERIHISMHFTNVSNEVSNYVKHMVNHRTRKSVYSDFINLFTRL